MCQFSRTGLDRLWALQRGTTGKTLNFLVHFISPVLKVMSADHGPPPLVSRNPVNLPQQQTQRGSVTGEAGVMGVFQSETRPSIFHTRIRVGLLLEPGFGRIPGLS